MGKYEEKMALWRRYMNREISQERFLEKAGKLGMSLYNIPGRSGEIEWRR
jgi:hypothetical protein